MLTHKRVRVFVEEWAAQLDFQQTTPPLQALWPPNVLGIPTPGEGLQHLDKDLFDDRLDSLPDHQTLCPRTNHPIHPTRKHRKLIPHLLAKDLPPAIGQLLLPYGALDVES